jgi:multiple sugar transport system permease protein
MYLWPLLTVRKTEFRPLTLGIVAFYTQQVQWANILTFASLITIPVLILFLFFQKWFIQSVASSGIKG